VGGSSDCHTFLHAFLWEHGGPMIDLNGFVPPTSSLTLTEATFIDDRGEIAVQAVLPNGDTHAVLLIPCGEGEEGCSDSVEGSAASQANPEPAIQIPFTPAPANPALSDGPGRMLDRLRARRFPGLRTLGPGTGPTN
jgi:hypothetical protein